MHQIELDESPRTTRVVAPQPPGQLDPRPSGGALGHGEFVRTF